jgi:hypothetical protein
MGLKFVLHLQKGLPLPAVGNFFTSSLFQSPISCIENSGEAENALLNILKNSVMHAVRYRQLSAMSLHTSYNSSGGRTHLTDNKKP